jgi:hypothetical protein
MGVEIAYPATTTVKLSTQVVAGNRRSPSGLGAALNMAPTSQLTALGAW